MENNLGNVNDLIQYFNLNKHIFEKDKNNKQHMERIMGMLTQQNMRVLEKQFQLYTRGLQLPTFIYLMKKLYTPENELSKYYFVSDLIKFFQAIDVNGDGHLQWSQFTQYIIQNIRRVQKPNYKNKLFQQNQIISSAYSKISNEYKITKIVDTGTSNYIKKVIYVTKQQKYFVLEQGSNSIKIFNDKFMPIDSFTLKGECQSSFIIDFSIDQANEIFCAIFQGSARFCNIKMASNIKFMNQMEEKKLRNFHKVEYLHLHRLWAFLSKSGEIKYSTVSYKSRTQILYTSELTLKQHQGIITDITQVQQPKYIVTSSMDGTIKLFSFLLKKSQVFQHISQETHSIINGKNKKGVLGIDYTREFGSYILSFGFSTNIFIYSLDISLTKGYTGKYSQHSGNLIAARFLKCYPYVLSFDDKLNLRIWDYRTFQTIQIINCQKNFINPSRLQIIPQLSECLICQKKITQFRAPSLQKKSKQINEFYSIFDFKICSMTNNIFLFTSNDVRVYNYITGCLVHVFTKLNQNSFQTNITAAQFGYKSRKFFLGDAAGYVREFDSETGEYLQQIKPDDENQYENKAIVKIIFLKEHSLLIVCSEDGRIMIYQRKQDCQFQIIRDIRQSHEELTSAAASVRYCLLATGSDNGTVNIWNLQKFSLQSVLVLKNRIVSIAFSPIHPIMLIVEETGTISFFYIKPYENLQMRYKCFLKIENKDIHGITQPISSFSFDLVINAYFNKKCSLIHGFQESKHHFIITLGQKNGQIIQANLNSLIQKFQIEQNHQIFTTKKSIRCQIQNAKTLISNQRNKIISLQGYSNKNCEIIDIKEFQNIKRFQAHSQKIDHLLLVKENSIVITTSADKKLKVWSLQGQLNGSIDFFTFKKINWKVSQINFHKKIQAIQTCIYAIKLIENKNFTKKQEEQIKIKLLMNQFMDDKEKNDYISWISVVHRNRNPKIRMRPIKNKTLKQIQEKNHEKQNITCQKKQKDFLGQENSQDQQILERYFRDIRMNQLPSDRDKSDENGSQKRISELLKQNKIQSMSSKEFDQIYRKLHNKITKKLNEKDNFSSWLTDNNSMNIQLSKIDMNKYKLSDNKRKQQNYKYFSNINTGKKVKSSNNHHKTLTNLNSKLSLNPKQQYISENESLIYQKMFKKNMQIPSQRPKKRKKTHILYHNLSEATRKIDIMSNMFGNPQSKLKLALKHGSE